MNIDTIKKAAKNITKNLKSNFSEIKSNPKQLLLFSIPFIIVFWLGNKLSYSFRIINAPDFSSKIIPAFSEFSNSITNPIPSFNFSDLLWGLIFAGIVSVVMIYKKKTAKKYRQGKEYGDARWGNRKDIIPYLDSVNFENNILLSQSERLTLGKPSHPKYARNKNVMVIGSSGSGKTRFFVKPNLMQMHSSYVVTDPKGTVLVECGKMLQRGRAVQNHDGTISYQPYRILVFDTIDFDKSMHYNPFAYIRPETREQDILKFVEVLIQNTTSQQHQSGDDFWVKAEKLLYTSYIALIICTCPEDEWNFETLLEFVNASECREDDESFRNAVDWAFFYLEKWLDNNWDENEEFAEENQNYKDLKDYKPTREQMNLGRFAIRQYKAYKLAAGKTAKSILISCSTRLGPFAIDKVLEITSYDEMQLDTIGDELTALFVIISDTDATFNFLVAIMYSQLFNLLCTKADNNPDGSGKLKNHVRFLLDEFPNTGQIPNFEKLIATIRSREISANIILQTKSQLKAIYKDNAETIDGNCDTSVFLGGSEKTTLKDISESLGKETIDMFTESRTRGMQESYGQNYQRLGKELKSPDEIQVMDNSYCIVQIRGLRPFFSKKFDITKHKQYKSLFDYDKKNFFDIKKYVTLRRNRKANLNQDTQIEIHQFECEE